MDRVSVVIPAFNASPYLGEAIDSVLNQTRPAHEVIVVDDGSTDDTGAVASRYGDRICYVRQANSGPAVARNRGIRESSGDLIAFLDADDQWLPEKLAKQLDCLAGQPQAGLAHTDLFYVREATGERSYVRGGRYKYTGRCYTSFFWENPIPPSTVMIRRACLDVIGLFDERIRRPSAEDLDLWIRIGRHYPFAYLDEPLVLYRQHSSNGSSNSHWMIENELYVLEKAIASDPDLASHLGQQRVREKLYSLAFLAGYQKLDHGCHEEARTFFRAATVHKGDSWKARALWALTYLPPLLLNRLRQYKRVLPNS